MEKKYDVIVIGSGPAGLTAGIYLARFKHNPLIIEGTQPGGQLTVTGAVENWPGNISIPGPELMQNMRKHAEKNHCSFLADSVVSVDFSKQPYTLTTESGKTLEAQAIVIATGASHKKLHVPGEEDYWGKGISVCATCDAPLHQDKDVVVVGGGNSGMYEAYELSKFAKSVTVIQHKDKITATDPIKDEVIGNPKITILLNTSVKEIKGDGKHVSGVLIETDGQKVELATNGIFVAIGLKPNTDVFKGQLDINEWGFIARHDHVHTSKEGIFAAGDVADCRYKQAITASGEGCMAALECEQYLK